MIGPPEISTWECLSSLDESFPLILSHTSLWLQQSFWSLQRWKCRIGHPHDTKLESSLWGCVWTFFCHSKVLYVVQLLIEDGGHRGVTPWSHLGWNGKNYVSAYIIVKIIACHYRYKCSPSASFSLALGSLICLFLSCDRWGMIWPVSFMAKTSRFQILRVFPMIPAQV